MLYGINIPIFQGCFNLFEDMKEVMERAWSGKMNMSVNMKKLKEMAGKGGYGEVDIYFKDEETAKKYLEGKLNG